MTKASDILRKTTGSSERGKNGPSLTRRALLASAGKIALLTMLPAACVPTANLPFADGTFWDDGTGWSG